MKKGTSFTGGPLKFPLKKSRLLFVGYADLSCLSGLKKTKLKARGMGYCFDVQFDVRID
jgi:hypothetical protein